MWWWSPAHGKLVTARGNCVFLGCESGSFELGSGSFDVVSDGVQFVCCRDGAFRLGRGGLGLAGWYIRHPVPEYSGWCEFLS
ncbi:hypothetical protein KC19_2G222800 [Ceratodon purpureus]|uniref:Uncharacterized protein n=1 Tax=Ceratodon purpureus TaxID=3225 RepID=A0A8T0IZV3_CERPU|nr:hypothetical protein KC19_2G222800 [Ceratodon purpureus]